jgi:hypothetical protein
MQFLPRRARAFQTKIKRLDQKCNFSILRAEYIYARAGIRVCPPSHTYYYYYLLLNYSHKGQRSQWVEPSGRPRKIHEQSAALAAIQRPALSLHVTAPTLEGWSGAVPGRLLQHAAGVESLRSTCRWRPMRGHLRQPSAVANGCQRPMPSFRLRCSARLAAL